MAVARPARRGSGKRRGLSGGGIRLPLSEQEVILEPAPAERWALYGHWKERELDAHVRLLAIDFAGLHHHIADSRKIGEAGLPDHLIVTGAGNAFYLEAKRFYRGKPTLPTVDTLTLGSYVRKGQETWLRSLWRAAFPCFLIYPTDIPDLHRLYANAGVPELPLYRRMDTWIRTGIWHLPCKP
jgi:hypothetical protein